MLDADRVPERATADDVLVEAVASHPKQHQNVVLWRAQPSLEDVLLVFEIFHLVDHFACTEASIEGHLLDSLD